MIVAGIFEWFFVKGNLMAETFPAALMYAGVI
jgi:hypothetical protein